MSSIKATRSGFVNLFTGMIRLVFAFIFITLVTRSLSVEQFGEYSFILSIIVYAVTSH
jgi:O-antigen/teichoic acid export membrane protein